MTITGVLIVRDEADCLRQCLDSFQDVVDDIVVVDTGSKDNTVDIARAYTSKVFSHPWQDDFAEARNAASAHATGDFILQIDADECADEPSGAREKLDAFVARHGENVIGTVLIRSTVWTGGEPQEAVDPVYRFFKRGAFAYEGAIHEQVVPLDGLKREAPTGLTFLHTGYSRDPQEAVEKYARNRRILERELAKNPDHEYLLYQLGKTYYATQDFAEAIGFFERSLKAIRFEGPQVTNLRGTVMAPEVATNLLASLSYAYINEGRIDAALDLLQAHEKIQHSGTEAADFYYVLGYAYLMKGDVPRSRTAYLASLGKGPDSECVLGTGSYASHYHLGLLHEAERELEKAVEEYVQALRLKPDYATVLTRLVDFAIDYGVALPKSVWECCDTKAFTETYLLRLERAVKEREPKQAEQLVQNAGALSRGLLEECKGILGRLSALDTE